MPKMSPAEMKAMFAAKAAKAKGLPSTRQTARALAAMDKPPAAMRGQMPDLLAPPVETPMPSFAYLNRKAHG